jgi:hypothetical protein
MKRTILLAAGWNHVRVDRNPTIQRMEPEIARWKMLKVKPVKPNNVQDSALVIIPPATPAKTR